MMFPLNPTIRRDDRLTDDEFYEFCQANPALRIEREADDQIIFEMSTNTKTGVRNAAPITEVVIWNRNVKSGLVADLNAGFKLPDTFVRAPDVSWISHKRWGALPEKGQGKSAKICPDFVIELIGSNRCSDSDEKYTLPAKIEKYLQNEVRPGWTIDPFVEQITIYRPDSEPKMKPFAETLTGEDVLPEFEIRLSNLL